MITRHGWGQVPDALRAGNQYFSIHRKLPVELTDSSINVARVFLYRRAVLMFIVDFLSGWTDGRLSDNKVCRAVPRPRRPEPSAVPSAWSGSISTSVKFDLCARGVSPRFRISGDTITSRSSRCFFALRAISVGSRWFEPACV